MIFFFDGFQFQKGRFADQLRQRGCDVCHAKTPFLCQNLICNSITPAGGFVKKKMHLP
jgi:hypothetical protein